MSPEGNLVVEIFGEGKTDVGAAEGPEPPGEGVVPILVHTLCGRPKRMLARRKRIAFLMGKGLWQKVRFAKRQARCNRSAAAVFVVDSEGGPKDLKKKRGDLEKGRDLELPDFPMALGVAQPCIEAWLLADAAAVRQGLELAKTPQVPPQPETLPAPRHDDRDNPKRVLARAVETAKKELSARQKDSIALAMNDMHLLRQRCPLGFAPLADEVTQRICPLF